MVLVASTAFVQIDEVDADDLPPIAEAQHSGIRSAHTDGTYVVWGANDQHDDPEATIYPATLADRQSVPVKTGPFLRPLDLDDGIVLWLAIPNDCQNCPVELHGLNLTMQQDVVIYSTTFEVSQIDHPSVSGNWFIWMEGTHGAQQALNKARNIATMAEPLTLLERESCGLSDPIIDGERLV